MILFISYTGLLGGAERQLVEIAGSLSGERSIACPEGPLAEAARGTGVRVFPLASRSLHVRHGARDRAAAPLRLAAHGREARDLVAALEPQLVVAWGMRSALALRGRATVFQHHDLLPGPLIARAVRFAAARARLVIVPSQTVARDLSPDGSLGQRVMVVHPGVDVERFDSDRSPADPPTVLVLGALVGWKRPELALEAFSLVRARRPDARLVLAGEPIEDDGRVRARLRERIARADLAGAVELVGAVDDSARMLREAVCLLHCAEREPFGLVVAEALASGRPAVVPDAGGPAEIVDEASGLLYPPGDAKGAAQALLEVLASPDRAEAIGRAGRARARELFDSTRSRSRYAALLKPLVDGGSAGLSPRPARGDLAIVTVTHNSAPELAAMLASVGRHLPEVHVVVADNASRDRSIATARAWDGPVTVLENAENEGFGHACNLALGQVTAPVTALLNPDVELIDDSLLELAAEAMRSDRLLAPRVLWPDGSSQDSVHPMPASWGELAFAIVPPAALPAALATPLAPWRSKRPRRVGWAIAAALVARTETLRRLGPFDERIFMYGEDMDLCLRAADAGIETWFWPSARVVHRGAHARDAAFGGEPYELLARGRREVVSRRLGPATAHRDDAFQALTFASRRALKLALGRPAGRERLQLAALAKARRGA